MLLAVAALSASAAERAGYGDSRARRWIIDIDINIICRVEARPPPPRRCACAEAEFCVKRAPVSKRDDAMTTCVCYVIFDVTPPCRVYAALTPRFAARCCALPRGCSLRCCRRLYVAA